MLTEEQHTGVHCGRTVGTLRRDSSYIQTVERHLRDPGKLVLYRTDEVASSVTVGVEKGAHVVRVSTIRSEAGRSEGVGTSYCIRRQNSDGTHGKSGSITVEPHDVFLGRRAAAAVQVSFSSQANAGRHIVTKVGSPLQDLWPFHAIVWSSRLRCHDVLVLENTAL